MKLSRRKLLQRTLALSAMAAGMPALFSLLPRTGPVSAYATPYKYPQLLLRGTGKQGDFDQRSVDDPIVFRAHGRFYMLYIGFDGVGYQTGLATSTDLVAWSRVALVGPRDSSSKYTKFNLAISSILRDKHLRGSGEAIRVNGQYLAAWNAYPSAGYEEGAAVIGLARSTDLLRWTLTEPILKPEEGAAC